VVVGIRVTVNEMVSEEAAYTPVLVGEKVAVSASVPTGRALVEVEAAPPLTVTGPPMGVVPTSNCTVPATPDVTAALRVTDVSNGWGLDCVVVRVVVVGPVTVNEMVSDDVSYVPVLVGEKVAVSESTPAGKALVEVEAAPPLTVTGPPMGVVPTSNWTVPATPDVTAAWSVIEVPAGWGLDCVVVRVVVVEIGLTVKVVVPVDPA
jgi:hypothetical protein